MRPLLWALVLAKAAGADGERKEELLGAAGQILGGMALLGLYWLFAAGVLLAGLVRLVTGSPGGPETRTAWRALSTAQILTGALLVGAPLTSSPSLAAGSGLVLLVAILLGYRALRQ